MADIPQIGPEKHEFEVRFLIRLDLIGVLKSGYWKNWILLKKIISRDPLIGMT